MLIPEAWHEPLVQRMVLINGAGETARAFYTWLQQDEARKMLSRYGFEVPADAPPAEGR